jgi:hypothetical protein
MPLKIKPIKFQVNKKSSQHKKFTTQQKNFQSNTKPTKKGQKCPQHEPTICVG